jgi:DNA-binding HxlR family transcriptional regulator
MPTPNVKRHPYDQWSPDARALDIVGDKWTLLIVRDLISGPRRFVELQRVLPGISTEQLRSRLNRMVADGMLTRKRYREVPPRVDYELTERSRHLASVLGQLARWGQAWAWSMPRPSERVDVGAIFRLIPGLAQPGEVDLHGRVALIVADGAAGHADHRGGMTAYLVTLGPAGATISEGPLDREAHARIRGTREAWTDALGPDARHGGLRISGNRTLARGLLEALAPRSRRAGDTRPAEPAAL